jgi:hypothetical protein
MKSFGQLLGDADKKMQYDTEACSCGNKNERSLESAPPIFAVGTVACSCIIFYVKKHYKEKKGKKLYRTSAFVAMFNYYSSVQNQAII